MNKVLSILNKAKKVLQKDPDLAIPLKQEEVQENNALQSSSSAKNVNKREMQYNNGF